MGLKEYEVMTEGRHPHKTTMLLNDADAKRLGVFGSAEKAAKTPTNKSRQPAANKKAPAKAAAKTPAEAEQTPPAPAGIEDASDPDASE
ncbi:hypothetical protein [Microbacterium sp. 8M]|uniref:hypothetical protein n=1 Tax=Microbacterium sp. 8M TaxID=2653153 RepID=UPI00135B8A85|nr:hypothetical protein [Microbacterium sp. 8M]